MQPPDRLERIGCAWRAVRFGVRRVLVGGYDHHHLARPEDRHGCRRQSAAGSASRVGVVQGVCVRARHVRVDACMRVGAYVRACVQACVFSLACVPERAYECVVYALCSGATGDLRWRLH